jgi:hypothetical protein
MTLKRKADVNERDIFCDAFAASRQSRRPLPRRVQRLANSRCSAAKRRYIDFTCLLYSNRAWAVHDSINRAAAFAGIHMETRMTTYFTIGDFILVIPMALAGALFVGALPCKTEFRHNALRVLGALIGVVFAVVLVEGLPALV